MREIVQLSDSHRGFILGYRRDYYPHESLKRFMFKAFWRSSLDADWIESHILLDTLEEVVPHARECINFNYLVEAWEAEHGRKMTLEEMTALGPNLDGKR